MDDVVFARFSGSFEYSRQQALAALRKAAEEKGCSFDAENLEAREESFFGRLGKVWFDYQIEEREDDGVFRVVEVGRVGFRTFLLWFVSIGLVGSLYANQVLQVFTGYYVLKAVLMGVGTVMMIVWTVVMTKLVPLLINARSEVLDFNKEFTLSFYSVFVTFVPFVAVVLGTRLSLGSIFVGFSYLLLVALLAVSGFIVVRQ